MNQGYKPVTYINVPPFFFLISLFAISTKNFNVFLFSANKKQHDSHVASGYFLPLIIATTSATL